MLLVLSILVCMFAVACDGYYHLIPIPDEERSSYSVDSLNILVQQSSVKVTVRGGSVQQPMTRKVYAGHLDIDVLVECDTECVWHFNRPAIVTNGISIHPFRLSFNDRLASRTKWGKSFYKEKSAADSILFGSRQLFAGQHILSLSFSAEDGGLKYLQFPILISLGRIEIRSDTVSLQDLAFNAAVLKR